MPYSGDMHRGGMENGGQNGRMNGRNNEYQRDYRQHSDRGQARDNIHHNNVPDAVKYDNTAGHHNGNGNGNNGNGVRHDGPNQGTGNNSLANNPQQVLSELDKRITSMQTDLNAALHKISGKENEKFDLIFSILTELQNRQGQLEDTVRSLKAQASQSSNSNGAGQQQQQGQPGARGGVTSQQPYAPMNGQMTMNGQMAPQMNGQMISVMQADGTQVLTPMPQVMLVQSPTGGMQQMQYMPSPMQQMATPDGMQPMQQMGMQFVGQNADYGNWGANAGGPGLGPTAPADMSNSGGISQVAVQESTEQSSSGAPDETEKPTA